MALASLECWKTIESTWLSICNPSFFYRPQPKESEEDRVQKRVRRGSVGGKGEIPSPQGNSKTRSITSYFTAKTGTKPSEILAKEGVQAPVQKTVTPENEETVRQVLYSKK